MKMEMLSLGRQQDLKDLKGQESPLLMQHKLQQMLLEKKLMNKV